MTAARATARARPTCARWSSRQARRRCMPCCWRPRPRRPRRRRAQPLRRPASRCSKLLLPRLGVECSLVEITDLRAVAAAMRPTTRLLLCESRQQPHARRGRRAGAGGNRASRRRARRAAARGRDLCDAHRAAAARARRGHRLPLGTKYFGGHSDLIGGVVSGPAELMKKVDGVAHPRGRHHGSARCLPLDRGLRTLAVRMAAHAVGAGRVAEFLASHPRVAAGTTRG